MQQFIHTGWAGQRLQHLVLDPQAAVSGLNYSEGGGNNDSHGECQEEYSPSAARCPLQPVQRPCVHPHAGQQHRSQDRQDVLPTRSLSLAMVGPAEMAAGVHRESGHPSPVPQRPQPPAGPVCQPAGRVGLQDEAKTQQQVEEARDPISSRRRVA